MEKKLKKKSRSELQANSAASQLASLPSTPATVKLMPPPARPQHVPIHQAPDSNHSDAGASARKKRRRRSRKSGLGAESISEGASVVSTNTTSNIEADANANGTTAPSSKPLVSGWSHVNGSSAENSVHEPLPAATRPSVRDTLKTDEERMLYDKEPELFGDYALSSVDEDASENDAGLVGNGTDSVQASSSHSSRSDAGTIQPILPRQNGVSAQNSRKRESQQSSNENSKLVGKIEPQRGTSSQSSTRRSRVVRPMISDAQVEATSVPEPPQLSSGRFACPYSDSHDCVKTYAYVRDARVHGLIHLEPDKFKCNICGKNMSRQDKLIKHMAQHDLNKQDAQVEFSMTNNVLSQSDVQDTVIASPPASATDYHATASKRVDQELFKTLCEPEVLDAEVTDAEAEPSDVLMDLDVEVTDAEPEPFSDDEAEVEYEALSGNVSPVPTTAMQGPKSIATVSQGPRKRKRQSPAIVGAGTTAKNSRKRVKMNDHVSPKVVHTTKSAIDLHAVEDAEATHGDLYSRAIIAADDSADSAESLDTTIQPPKERRHLSRNGHNHSSDSVLDQPSSANPKSRAKAFARKEVSSIGESSQCGKQRETSIPVRSRPEPQFEKRQSSLDTFVERSGIEKVQSKPPSSEKRIVINVPPRPIPDERPNKSKSGLVTSSTKKRLPTHKGKERATSSDEHNSNSDVSDGAQVDDERTSSDDRPKATTIARRTSSLSSKEPRISKKRKKPESDEDHSDASSESEAARSRGKNRPPNREASFKELAKMGEIGRFRDKEIRLLHDWRDRFCEEHNITNFEFNDMMTATLRKKIEWKPDISRNDFLQQFYDQLPNRNRRAMLRFRERHFQNLEDDKWTEEQDKELKDLVQQLGTKWVQIGQMMGRSPDFVTQRWIHRLNRGKTRNLGPWTAAEEKVLYREVQAIAKANGKKPTSKSLIVPWAAISEKLGTNRTAQQCSNKWRNETTKKVGEIYVEIPLNDRMPSSGTKAPRTPSKMAQRLAGNSKTPTSRASSSTKTYKSAERIEDSEEADDDHNEDPSDKHLQAKDGDDAPLVDPASVTEGLTTQDSSDEEKVGAGQESNTEDQANLSNEDDSTEGFDQGNEVDQDLSQENVAAGTNGVRRYIPSPSPPPRPSQSQKPNSPLAKPSRLSQRTSPKPPVDTYKTPKNPLPKNSDANDRPSLSQVFAATQASTSSKSTSGRSIPSRARGNELPNRPSPGNSIRKRPLSSHKTAVSPLRNDKVELGHPDVDDVKSPNSFVSAREEDASGEEEDDDADSTENEADSTEDQSGSDSTSSSDTDSEANTEEEDESEEDNKPPVATDSQTQSGGFWGSIRNTFFKAGSQQKTRPMERKQRALDKALEQSADEVQSDDDDE